MEKFSIIIGGDTVPTESNYDLFSEANIDELADIALQNVLFSSDYRIFNLETPLCDIKNPIPKCGPNLIAPKSTINGLKAFRPSLFMLANNHILDHGDKGLFDTFDLLQNENIPYIGSGKNLMEAGKPYIIEQCDKKIGIYNCAEHEFTIATEGNAGANPFDPFESLDHIYALKQQCDYVIVIYHGGKEHYRYPSPYLQKVCRKICEKGADLVLCQHSHCIGCEEHYESSVIVYGQGNFLFDYLDIECWQTSLLVKVTIEDKIELTYIPICKNENAVRMADQEEAESILNDFYKRSREISEEGFISSRYHEFALENKASYFYTLAGREELCKYPFSIDFNPSYQNSTLLAMMNYLRCEPHSELVLTALQAMVQEGEQ